MDTVAILILFQVSFIQRQLSYQLLLAMLGLLDHQVLKVNIMSGRFGLMVHMLILWKHILRFNLLIVAPKLKQS